MKTEIRLAWEPENRTPLSFIEKRMASYMTGKGGVTILGNGTLLFITDGDSDELDARKAMDEARFLIDFEVEELREGGYLVCFHDAVAVFVGAEEFAAVRGEVERRLPELRFPEEQLLTRGSSPRDHLLIGLYGRGKLQRDAYHFRFHKRIRG